MVALKRAAVMALYLEAIWKQTNLSSMTRNEGKVTSSVGHGRV